MLQCLDSRGSSLNFHRVYKRFVVIPELKFLFSSDFEIFGSFVFGIAFNLDTRDLLDAKLLGSLWRLGVHFEIMWFFFLFLHKLDHFAMRSLSLSRFQVVLSYR